MFHSSFDVGIDNTFTKKVAATEQGFDVIYNNAGLKNLQLRFRGNFPRDVKKTSSGETMNWNEYRFIANYDF